MKLISLSVDGFGGISDYETDFNEGFNIRLEENGWGKTSLAAFLRVMFYGLDNEKKRTELENDRKHFKPWHGGAFGGSITFEASGKRYRAERRFGNKASEDLFQLFDAETDLPSEDYSENLGQELFGIDKDSFLQTVFVGQQHVKADATNEIHAKLGKTDTDAFDMKRYDEAMDALHSEENSLTGARKTGKLFRLRKRMSLREAQILRKPQLNGELLRLQSEKDLKEAEQQMLEQKLGQLRSDEGRLRRQQKLQTFAEEEQSRKKQLDALQEELAELNDRFPNGIGAEDEIQELLAAFGRLDELKHLIEDNTLTEEEKRHVEDLDSQIWGIPYGSDPLRNQQEKRIPTPENLEEQILERKADNRELSRKKLERQESALSAQEQIRFREEQLLFSYDCPDVKKLEGLKDEWNDLMGRYRELQEQGMELKEQKEEAQEQLRREKSRHSAAFVPCLLMGCFLLITGVFLLSRGRLMMGIVLAVAAVLCAVCAFFLDNIRKPGQEYTEKLKGCEEQIVLWKEQREQWKEQKELTQKKADRIFRRVGWRVEADDISEQLTLLIRTAEDYRSLQARTEEGEKDSERKRADEISGQIHRFLLTHTGNSVPEEQYADALDELQMQLQDYRRIQSKRAVFEEAAERLEQIQDRTDRFLEDYPDRSSVLDRKEALQTRQEFLFRQRNLSGAIMDAQRNLKDYCTEYQSELAEYDEMKHSNLLPGEAEQNEEGAGFHWIHGETGSSSFESLQSQMDEIRDRTAELEKEKMYLDHEMDDLSASLRNLDEQEILLKEEKEKERDLMHRLEILRLTQQFLSKSKEEYHLRYVEPIRSSFEKYYRLIAGEDRKSYRMNTDLGVVLEEGSISRDTALMSSGYQDLLGLCKRFAMLDAMYEKEKPFVILDDPLVNLDDEKLAGGLEFLKELSSQYQILYFTCHSSRVPE